MMFSPKAELSERNFIRIGLINWFMSLPLLLFFSWPFWKMSNLLFESNPIHLLSALLFGLPFMLTILHGHVSIALGALHRDMYYRWLTEYKYSYGLGFSPLFVSTRFRITLLSASLILFLAEIIFALE